MFAFKVMHRVILLIRFCKLLTRVAIVSGRGARAASASLARRLWMHYVDNGVVGNKYSAHAYYAVCETSLGNGMCT